MPKPCLARREAGLTFAICGSRDLAAFAAALVDTLVLLADLLDAGAARALNVGSVSVVGVDASKNLAARRFHVLDGDDTLGAVTLAVTARAVKLAEVGDGEAVDGDGRGTVVLDDPEELLVDDR